MIWEYNGKNNKQFWLDEAVDSLLDYAEKNGVHDEIVCSAGMTPSCPIHFGIFRELAITSFVTQELKRRGKKARFIYFWDNFDHFCKIPYFKTESQVKDHVGKMLSAVPDFLDEADKGAFASYGEHIMSDFERVVAKCGFAPEYNYQESYYRSGKYDSYIETALNKRGEIFDIINSKKMPYTDALIKKREGYYPLEVYCPSCLRDKTTVTGWNSKTKQISFTCGACGHKGVYTLGMDFCGKLAWKVNWATRWKDSAITYESSGENQLTDTGSYAVSSRIVTEIYGGKVPFSLLYRFVGVPGVAKISRALGEKALATRFTDVLEPAIVRYLFLRNAPTTAFTVDIENGIDRIYNEWDSFCSLVESGRGTETDKKIYELARSGVCCDRKVIAFNKICMALAYSQNDMHKAILMLKKCGLVPKEQKEDDVIKDSAVRFGCASAWLFKYGKAAGTHTILHEFNAPFYDSLDGGMKAMLEEFMQDIRPLEKEDEIGGLIYAVPKRHAKDELEAKRLTKDFMQTMYMLLLGEKQGPRLATMLGLMEAEEIRRLLSNGR